MSGGSPPTDRRLEFLADTVALLLFFTSTGALSEPFVAGMQWDQVLRARLLGAILMVPVARRNSKWRGWDMRRNSDSLLSRFL